MVTMIKSQKLKMFAPVIIVARDLISNQTVVTSPASAAVQPIISQCDPQAYDTYSAVHGMHNALLAQNLLEPNAP
jgi:hypothetical protein